LETTALDALGSRLAAGTLSAPADGTAACACYFRKGPRPGLCLLRSRLLSDLLGCPFGVRNLRELRLAFFIPGSGAKNRNAWHTPGSLRDGELARSFEPDDPERHGGRSTSGSAIEVRAEAQEGLSSVHHVQVHFPGILNRLGNNVETWRGRLEKLKSGRLLGRFFAASRERLREVAARLGVHHLANLAGCPARYAAA
jgi:hypothetical protein